MTEALRGPVAVGAAFVLAVVLGWAAVAKLRSRDQTQDDFESLGLVGSKRLAVAVPVVELATAGLLVLVPSWGGVVAAALLAAFTAVIVRVLREPDGLTPTCACFGGSTRSPLSWRHLARNGALLILALLAASFDGAGGPILGSVLY